MKAKMPSTRSGTSKARPRKVRRVSADAPGGCGYSVTWSLLAATTGYAQVWIPKKMYDKAAAHFMKAAKGRYEKNLLRQRMAPLALSEKCGGTCSGGWCQEHLIFDGGSSKVFVCECAYFT
jgi:hypothetical protein